MLRSNFPRKLFKLLYGNVFNTQLAFGLMLSLLQIWKFIWASEDDVRSTSNPTLLTMFIYSYFACLADTVFMLENEEENVSISKKQTAAVLGLSVPFYLAITAGAFEVSDELVPDSLKESQFYFHMAASAAAICALPALPGIFWTYADSLVSAKFAAFSILKQVFTHEEFKKLSYGEKGKLYLKLVFLILLPNLNDHASDVLVFEVIGKALVRYFLASYSAEISTGSIITGSAVALGLALLDLNLVTTEVFGKTLDKFDNQIGVTDLLLTSERIKAGTYVKTQPKPEVPCFSKFISRTLLVFNSAAYIAISPTLITLFVKPSTQGVKFWFLSLPHWSLNLLKLSPLVVICGVPGAWAAWKVYEDATYHLFTCNNNPTVENINDIENQDETKKPVKKKAGFHRMSGNRHMLNWLTADNESKEKLSSDETAEELDVLGELPINTSDGDTKKKVNYVALSEALFGESPEDLEVPSNLPVRQFTQ